MDLNTPLRSLGPVFRMKAKVLEKLGITTVEELFYHIPFRYDSNLLVSKIGIAQVGESLTLQGVVISATNFYTKRRLSIQRVKIEDSTGIIECVFFNQKFLLKTVTKGDMMSVAGRVDRFGNKKTLAVKTYEVLKNSTSDAIHTTGLVPIYSETKGISSKWIRGRIKQLLDQNEQINDYLPSDIKKQNNLIDLRAAIEKIHFPKSKDDAIIARARLSFDELFLKHAASLIRKKEWEGKLKTTSIKTAKEKKKIQKLIKSLPFKLTSAQERAVEDIFKDLDSDIPMNRLLEGDVGSGKTVVAAIAAYAAHLNGFQVALMAPTEILANQHYKTITSILSPLKVQVELITGTTAKNKGKKFDIAVGTHALLHGKAEFDRLGLVIIDEQQRFGVSQRALIREKGNNPHLLTMTATPIPRTIFLTIYADLAVSFLDELPKGRKKIKTHLVPETKRKDAYKWIESKIKTEKSQVFIVCPFIEPSETMSTVKAAIDEYEKLKTKIFPKLKLGLLHGRMKAEEKSEAVKQFKEGKVDILVATPVIEVGIDVPAADIMLIEASERFGLAQLHQLRGRVGRGEKQSYCFLFTDSKSDTTRERLGYMQTIDNGAKLAEIDLKLRGPGEMFGTSQHGMPELKIATFSDFPLFERARKSAEKMLPEIKKYPQLFLKISEVDTPKISRD